MHCSFAVVFTIFYLNVSAQEDYKVLDKITFINHLLQFRKKARKGVYKDWFKLNDDSYQQPPIVIPTVDSSNHQLPPPKIDAEIIVGQKTVDLDLSAYLLFQEACGPTDKRFVWGVFTTRGIAPVRNSWTSDRGIPGFLIPRCVCSNGKLATLSDIVELQYLHNFEMFIASGYSVVSSIKLETCVHEKPTEYWSTECQKVCHVDHTLDCNVSTIDSVSVVKCSCILGYDPDTNCYKPLDACSNTFVDEKGDYLSGNKLCRVSLKNVCFMNANSFMCQCFYPYFEDVHASKYPNCLGKRKSDNSRCEFAFCGNGECVMTKGASTSSCKCEPGYGGSDCMTVLGDLAPDWSKWTKCYPPCGSNYGMTHRERVCLSGNPYFCHGLRREYRRCQPTMCTNLTIIPTPMIYTLDNIPISEYMWCLRLFIKSLPFLILVGVFSMLFHRFYDSKFESLQAAGQLSQVIKDVSDTLVLQKSQSTDTIYRGFHVPPYILKEFADRDDGNNILSQSVSPANNDVSTASSSNTSDEEGGKIVESHQQSSHVK